VKLYCRSCRIEVQRPFRPTHEEMHCDICEGGLSVPPKERKPLERRSRSTQPRSIADALRSRKRDWTLAHEKVADYAMRFETPCVWRRLGECGPGKTGGGRDPEACHVIGRERDAFPPLRDTEAWVHAEERGVWLVAPDRIVPGCRRHHEMYDAGEIPLVGYLTLAEELQAVADCHTEGTRESGLSIALHHHLDRPDHEQRASAA